MSFIRKEVQDFADLGPLPAESDDESTDETLVELQARLERITRPVTDEEAALLVHSFGPDDCFGGAWSLLHLIETAPGGCPIRKEPTELDNEWVRRLWSRWSRSQP